MERNIPARTNNTRRQREGAEDEAPGGKLKGTEAIVASDIGDEHQRCGDIKLASCFLSCSVLSCCSLLARPNAAEDATDDVEEGPTDTTPKFLAADDEAGAAARKLRQRHPQRPTLLPRRWEDSVERTKINETLGTTSIITFMQFNILADGLAARDREKQGGFKDCPIDALRWPEYRRDRVLEEILRHGNFPDVVALEEVDHFYDDLSPAMEELGYRGVYVKKPDSPCKQQSGDPNLEDGCALFWRRETFEEVVDEAASVWYVNFDEVTCRIGTKL